MEQKCFRKETCAGKGSLFNCVPPQWTKPITPYVNRATQSRNYWRPRTIARAFSRVYRFGPRYTPDHSKFAFICLFVRLIFIGHLVPHFVLFILFLIEYKRTCGARRRAGSLKIYVN